MLIRTSVKKGLLGLSSASALAAGASYYFLSNDTSKKVDLNEVKSRIKNRKKTDWSKTVTDIKNTDIGALPEGLRSAKTVEANAARWVELFCDEADYDMNDNNVNDYLKYCI